MTVRFSSLKPQAGAELARQIETMEPSAAVLESTGFAFQLAAYLAASIKSGTPDLSELRSHAVDLKTAVEICTAISKRHARKSAAITAIPPAAAPKPAPVKPAAPEPDAFNAASMLHTLFEELEGGRAACLTTLMRDGWSESTAKELVRVSSASRRAFPRVTNK
jgi:hypothetical protein